MIQDYITYLTDDLKIAHTVLPFGADDFILILCNGGRYTLFYINELRWVNIGSFSKPLDNQKFPENF